MAQGIFNLKQVNQAIRQGAWSAFNPPQFVEYLVVAGGGGASRGGGGAGGLLTGMVPVVAGSSYTVTVGGGGAGANDALASSGQNSVFGTITSTGGGGGSSGQNAGSGGSGGAGGIGSPLTIGGQGTSGQGNAGANGYLQAGVGTPAGGGGGAGTVGIKGVNGQCGNGGAGIASAISGSVTTYAAGGGGGSDSGSIAGGIGGVGGGGNGVINSGTVVAGTVNTGGGGGGTSGVYTGGSGGSGIVVVRYPGTVQFYTGGTVNYANGYIIHTFYSNGTLAPTTPTQYSNTYQISRSLRFNSADSPYLNRTPGSAGNRRTWTWSGWVKRTAFGANGSLFFTGTSYTETTAMGISFSTGGGNDTDCLNITTGQQVFRRSTNQLRDPSAWYHLVVAFDTTQSNATDRVKMYVNNVLITSFVLSNNPVQNTEYGINQAAVHWIGGDSVIAGTYLNGYMADVHFIDGQQLTPSSFGEYDVNTGVWEPRSYGGSYGTNGFKLNFSDNTNTTAATLGADSSGNGNNWTPNNFSVTAGVNNDSFVDTPTQYGTDTGVGGEVRGNYCTVNALTKTSNMTLTNGNLDCVSSDTDWAQALGTIGMSSGKWYFEVTKVNAGGGAMVGIAGASVAYSTSTYIYQSPVGYLYYQTGQKYNNNVDSAYGASYTAGDVVGVAFDADAGTLVFYKNGASQGTAFSGLTSGPYLPAILPNNTTGNLTCNFGQRAFAYTAPTGFKALCTTNLPTPTIGATATTQANKYFNPVTYTGAGGTQAVSVGFQPDFVWMKSRSNSSTGHILQNAVTGVTKGLQSNSTDPEFTDNTTLTEFNSAGFKVGGNSQTNLSATTYVAWNWKANGAGVTNTDGSITSTVSANPTAGFSIVTYASTTGTVGHGLGVVPSVIIMKGRNVTDQWAVYHISMGNTYAIPLNSTGAGDINSSFWNNTTPTSTVFSQGSWDSGYNKVAYCFAPIAGYSAFGKYTGTGSGDGPFVYTGFRPAFLLIKRTDTTNSWIIYDSARDTYNVAGKELLPDSNGAEATYTIFDFLSNGFKLRTNAVSVNAFGGIYIYMAFAENPFKYSLAR